MAFRPFILAAALLPSVVACGGGDDGGNVTPEGTHYHYVANEIDVPTTNTQSNEYGLDLDGMGSMHDNALGQALAQLAGFGFDAQGTISKAVAEGSIILLLDFQTKSFDSSSASGIQAFLGDQMTAQPAPCGAGETYDETTMMGCGHHLTGGSFTLDADSPPNAALGGKIVGGTFTGGPGTLHLELALGGTAPIPLDLIGARAKGSMLSETGLGNMILAGAISKMDMDTKVIPAIQVQLTSRIAEDCTMLDTPPDCGCTAGSTGAMILGFLDTKLADGTTDGMDCKVSEDEIKNNPIVSNILSPDVTIDGVEALSLGIKVVGVTATYTVAGQQ